MSFSARPASVDWEPLPISELPEAAVWAWFRPEHAPLGCVIQIPVPAYQTAGPRLTMRRLLTSIGLPVGELHSWTVRGMAFDPMQGQNPLLDQPLPPPVENDPGVLIVARPPVAAASVPTAFAPVATPMSETSQRWLNAMENDWNSILQTEANMQLIRQQLNGLQGRLSSLNRELNPEEANHADSLMKREWQDARRWLRDSANLVSRSLREYDVGLTSAAGVRNRFEQIYNDWVRPRRAFDGMESVQKEFETHRRTVQHLLQSMSQAVSNAARDGEQRAQQILARIAAKVRTARTKR